MLNNNIFRYLLFSLLLIVYGCKDSTSGPDNTEALILEFGISEYPSLDFEIDQELNIIYVSNDEGLSGDDDISSLTPIFTLSDGARIIADQTEITGNSTPLNFTDGINLNVVSEDSLTTTIYFVYLTENLPLAYFGIDNITITNNPSENAPLSALAEFESSQDLEVEITITQDPEFQKIYSETAGNLAIPIHGLYAGISNEVHLTISNENELTTTESFLIETDPLPDFFPDITIDVAQENMMEPGWHYQSISIGNSGSFNTYPTIYDNNGDVRWYLDLSDYQQLVWPFKFSLSNEEPFIYTGLYDAVLELDMFGNELNKISISGTGYRLHHDVTKLPHGNYILAVNKDGATITKNGETLETVEDHIVEVDYHTGEIITEWDMREILDVSRVDVVDGGHDWFHMNAVWYDDSDESLIISGRNQGLVKVDWDNNLKWILAAHQGWGNAGKDGEGIDTTPYLLTAVDATGNPLSDDIQQGIQESTEFSWTWGQHAPMTLNNRNIFVFDNGTNRNFGTASNYSLASEYEIDEENMTARLVWSYGKERGSDTFSNIISDVDVLPETGNRLFLPGFIRGNSAKIVEISYPDKTVVFESTLNMKGLLGNGNGWGEIDIVYRGHRVDFNSLY